MQTHVRYRIRLARRGLMRFLGQLDMMRTIERALRRCGFRLRPREGFRTNVKLSFPISLPLGFEAEREVFQVDLGEEVSAEELAAALQAELPEGLTIVEVRRVGPYERVRLLATVYEFPVPPDRLAQVAAKVREWEKSASIPVAWARKSGLRHFDLRRDLRLMRLNGNRLRFEISHQRDPTVRPVEVLEWLGVADLLQEGLVVVRTDVVLADEVEIQDGAGFSVEPDTQNVAGTGPSHQLHRTDGREGAEQGKRRQRRGAE